MSEYSWNDVIVDPTSEEAKANIGKRIYHSNTPYRCIRYANKQEYDYSDILTGINTDSEYPFEYYGVNKLYHVCCIIPKKEE